MATRPPRRYARVLLLCLLRLDHVVSHEITPGPAMYTQEEASAAFAANSNKRVDCGATTELARGQVLTLRVRRIQPQSSSSLLPFLVLTHYSWLSRVWGCVSFVLLDGGQGNIVESTRISQNKQ
jgi:hypothetical protein